MPAVRHACMDAGNWQVCMHAFPCTWMHACMQASMHTDKHGSMSVEVSMHACMQAGKHACMEARRKSGMQTCTSMHASPWQHLKKVSLPREVITKLYITVYFEGRNRERDCPNPSENGHLHYP